MPAFRRALRALQGLELVITALGLPISGKSRGKILPVPTLMGLIEIRKTSHGLSMGWKNKESFFRAGQAGSQAFPGFWHTSLGHEHYALPGL